MEEIRESTTDAELAEMLAGADPTVLMAGHTHVQLVRRHDSTLVVNPGSVGSPFNARLSNGAVRMSPWAEYAILTASEGGISAELRRTRYDVSALRGVALESGMPHSEWWSAQWLRPEQT
jgi:predicted phosphodiesterase